MDAITGGLSIVAGLVLARGLLAMADAAMAGARRSRLREWASRGDRGAAAAIRLGEDRRGPSPTLRAGILLLDLLAGVVAGVAFQRALARVAGPAGGRGVLATVAVVVGLALAMIVVGEMIPGRIAMQRPEAIARIVARPSRILVAALGPVVGALATMTDGLLRVVGFRRPAGPPVTEDSVRELMREGTRAGIFEQAEQEMVQRVLRFGRRRAHALMTPRDRIVWIDVADSPEEIRRKVSGTPHSHFLVCDQSLDSLVGIVHVKDLLGHGRGVEPFRFKGRLTLPTLLYEGTHGLKILEMLRASGTHIAVVLDEFGTVRGLLTLTDILQAIIGDLPDRSEDDLPRAVRQPDGAWLLDGRLPVEDLRDLLDLPELPRGDYHTLGGLVVAHLGHIPTSGEGFDAWGLRVDVIGMDGNRVDRLRLARPGANDPTS